MVHPRSAGALLAPLCVAMFAGPSAWAGTEPAATGRIVGAVFDQTGNPLPGVKLAARRQGDDATARATYSTTEGDFVLDGLPVGPYAVHAAGPKVKTVVSPGVVVAANSATELNVIMEVPGLSEEVLSCGGQQRPIVDGSIARRTESDADFVAALPLPLGLPVEDIAPFILSWHALEGGSRLVVDGFSLSDPVTGQSWLRLPAAAVASLQSRAYGFGADAPESGGSALALITLSGSNKAELATSAGHELARDERTTRGGLLLSGPLVRDHAWYSVAADVTGARNSTNELDTATRVARATAKVSWMLNSRNRLTAMTIVNGDRIDRGETLPGLPGATFGARGGGRFAGLTLEDLLTDNLVTRFQIAAGQTYERIESTGAGSAPDPAVRTSRTRALELGAMLQWFPGRLEHAVTLELRGRRADHHGTESARGARLFLDLSDQLRPNRYVTVTGGLGWLGARGETDTGGTATSGWAMTPHLGLAWDATRDGRTVVRANVERRADPGSVVTTTTKLPHLAELALGAERELIGRTALSVDLVHRRFSEGWRALMPGATPRRSWAFTTTISRREGRVRLLGGYTFIRATVSAGAPPIPPAHLIKLHATATMTANLSVGGLYHFRTGGAGETFGYLTSSAAPHAGGVRLQYSVRLADDYSFTLFADGMAAAPLRAAVGLEARY